MPPAVLMPVLPPTRGVDHAQHGGGHVNRRTPRSQVATTKTGQVGGRAAAIDADHGVAAGENRSAQRRPARAATSAVLADSASGTGTSGGAGVPRRPASHAASVSRDAGCTSGRRHRRGADQLVVEPRPTRTIDGRLPRLDARGAHGPSSGRLGDDEVGDLDRRSPSVSMVTRATRRRGAALGKRGHEQPATRTETTRDVGRRGRHAVRPDGHPPEARGLLDEQCARARVEHRRQQHPVVPGQRRHDVRLIAEVGYRG